MKRCLVLFTALSLMLLAGCAKEAPPPQYSGENMDQLMQQRMNQQSQQYKPGAPAAAGNPGRPTSETPGGGYPGGGYPGGAPSGR